LKEKSIFSCIGNAVSKWIGKNMETHVKLFEALLCADVQDVYRAAATTVANLAKDKGYCTCHL